MTGSRWLFIGCGGPGDVETWSLFLGGGERGGEVCDTLRRLLLSASRAVALETGSSPLAVYAFRWDFQPTALCYSPGYASGSFYRQNYGFWKSAVIPVRETLCPGTKKHMQWCGAQKQCANNMLSCPVRRSHSAVSMCFYLKLQQPCDRVIQGTRVRLEGLTHNYSNSHPLNSPPRWEKGVQLQPVVYFIKS